MNVPRMAATFNGQGVFQISVLPLLQFDHCSLDEGRRSALVGLERGSGVALEEVHTMTPSMLTKETLKTARIWTSKELVIGFGHKLPEELHKPSQVLLHSCLSVRKSQGQFVLRCTGTQEDKQLLEAARCFQRAGVLACTGQQQDYQEST